MGSSSRIFVAMAACALGAIASGAARADTEAQPFQLLGISPNSTMRDVKNALRDREKQGRITRDVFGKYPSQSCDGEARGSDATCYARLFSINGIDISRMMIEVRGGRVAVILVSPRDDRLDDFEGQLVAQFGNPSNCDRNVARLRKDKDGLVGCVWIFSDGKAQLEILNPGEQIATLEFQSSAYLSGMARDQQKRSDQAVGALK